MSIDDWAYEDENGVLTPAREVCARCGAWPVKPLARLCDACERAVAVEDFKAALLNAIGESWIARKLIPLLAKLERKLK
jgi:hypothetical protein